jgi:hypothetical protein
MEYITSIVDNEKPIEANKYQPYLYAEDGASYLETGVPKIRSQISPAQWTPSVVLQLKARFGFTQPAN